MADIIFVAVKFKGDFRCSVIPAGRYQFLGYVHDKEGRRIGERPQDEPQFDPGVLTEGEKNVFVYRILRKRR